MKHVIASLIFVGALLFIANPTDTWMPSMAQYAVALVIMIVAAAYIGLFLTDTGRDEREVMLRAEAARYGYVAGIAVLSLGIAWALCGARHPDPWLLLSLAAMVLVRVGVRLRD